MYNNNYNSNLLYGKHSIQSVISDCSLVNAFGEVLHYFDPNKNQNYKSKILDCSHSMLWSEKDMRLYNISQTKNLNGTVNNTKFDVIIFEPIRNKNFYQDAIKFSKIFNTLLKPESVIIIKMNDFKEKGSKELKGSFDVWDIFSDAGFYLQDNIIYNFNTPSIPCEGFDRCQIVHIYFMIFKKKGETK